MSLLEKKSIVSPLQQKIQYESDICTLSSMKATYAKSSMKATYAKSSMKATYAHCLHLQRLKVNTAVSKWPSTEEKSQCSCIKMLNWNNIGPYKLGPRSGKLVRSNSSNSLPIYGRSCRLWRCNAIEAMLQICRTWRTMQHQMAYSPQRMKQPNRNYSADCWTEVLYQQLSRQAPNVTARWMPWISLYLC